MTNRPENPVVRRAARVAALLPVLLVTSLTSVARAEAPETWEQAPAVSVLETLLVVLGIPAGLFVLITLLVMLPTMGRDRDYAPGEAWRAEPEWFGGPRTGREVTAGGQQAAVGTGAPGSEESDPTRGGASGRW